MKFRQWLKGLVGGIIGGAATAGGTWLGMSGAKSMGLDVPTLNFKSLGIIILSGGLTSLFAYLAKSPVPPDEDGTGNPS